MRRAAVALPVLVVSAAAAGAALSAEGEPLPPSIGSATPDPLFALADMAPGDAPVARCIAVEATGGTSPTVALGAVTGGDLAPALRLRVQAGTGATGPSCDGFAPTATLYEGALDAFARQAGEVVDARPLAPGAPLAYRYVVWLPADTDLDRTEVRRATQDLSWTGTFDDPAVTAAGGPAVPACGVGPADRPRRTVAVGGRRVSVLTAPSRVLRPGEPLLVRVVAGRGLVRAVSYAFSGRAYAATPGSAGFTARIPAADFGTGTKRLVARLRLAGGARRSVALSLAMRSCPAFARAVAGGRDGRDLQLRVQAAGLTSAVVRLPAGVRPSARGVRVLVLPVDGGTRGRLGGAAGRAPAGGLPGVVVAGRTVRITGLPAGAGTTLVRLRVPAAARRPVLAARCRRARVVAVLTTASGTRRVANALQGTSEGCG